MYNRRLKTEKLEISNQSIPIRNRCRSNQRSNILWYCRSSPVVPGQMPNAHFWRWLILELQWHGGCLFRVLTLLDIISSSLHISPPSRIYITLQEGLYGFEPRFTTKTTDELEVWYSLLAQITNYWQQVAVQWPSSQKKDQSWCPLFRKETDANATVIRWMYARSVVITGELGQWTWRTWFDHGGELHELNVTWT